MRINVTKSKGTFINIKASDEEVTVDVSVGDIRKDYEKDEVLNVLKKMVLRMKEFQTSNVEVKITTVERTSLVAHVMQDDARIYKHEVIFNQLDSPQISRQAKLTYVKQSLDEVWNRLSKEERRENFDKLLDAWDEYQAELERELRRKLKEESK